MLVYSALALVIFSSILLLIYGLRLVRWLTGRFRSHKGGAKVRRPGLGLFVFLLLMLAAGMILFFTGFFMYSFHALTQETKIADVVIMETNRDNTFTVRLHHAPDSGPGEYTDYELKGDQWMIEADILKWDSWLALTGMKTRYRLTRLRGRYQHQTDEMSRPAAVVSLDPREDHFLWRYLYRFGPELPFVDAVYGNAAYQDARAGKKFSVYVSNSGLTVRPLE